MSPGKPVPDGVRRAASQWPFLSALLLTYLVALVVMDGLTFAPRKDERHFWPTALAFSRAFPPAVDDLRGYNELNTPLPFVVFGALEYFFGGGIAVGRFVNLGLSLLMACAVAFASPLASRGWLSAAGLVAFPYFLFAATHFYTDVLASFFVLGGVILHLKSRHISSAAAFAAAIACRQYAVAFPLAILVAECVGMARGRHVRPGPAAWASLAACASLLGWYAFFGGFAPPRALAAQSIDTGRAYVDHGLYFLACVGAYFVLVEAVLFRQPPGGMRSRAGGVLGVGTAALVFVFPPMQNVDYAIASMGVLDRAARLVFDDGFRIALFSLLAAAAAARFSRPDLGSLFVWTNAILMTWAHIGWDKYALPLLVALWYLKSAASLDDVERAARS